MNDDVGFYKRLLDNLYDGVYFVNRDREIVYWNKAAEKLTGYAREEILGKRCSDNILIHVNDEEVLLCKEGCPLHDVILDGRTREVEVYLHHKDGYRIPVMVRVAPIRNSAGDIVGAVEIFGDNSRRLELSERLSDLEKLALIDPLTKLSNRRFVDMNLESKLKEMQRYGVPFGILFIDIDHFKEVNDTYGHPTGDSVLQMVAQTLLNAMRPFDIIGRWGGEEFVAIIVNVNKETLCSIAQRVRFLVEKSHLPIEGGHLSVTVSVGATLSRKDDTVTSLLRRADQLMYRCKVTGRNRVLLD